ncbi:MAG: molybdopterin oxidoreductase [Candidatus Dadabacteria bacterium]|nr:MAG: molybdopterin oxidoreductase [Candidatus Dadabacteria bacterium]
MSDNNTPKGLTRRDTFRCAAFLGATGVLGKVELAQAKEAAHAGSGYPLVEPENTIYSVCLQCHTSCPLRVKILDGVAVKIDGNPYSPQTVLPHIEVATKPQAAAVLDGKLCPKGQAGLQTLYDPYRLTKVLKRTGKRGENKWKTIPFEQAIKEIVEGGKLFADVPGEENRVVPGLRELYALRDPKLSKAMKADAMAVGKGKMAREAFKQKYKDHLDVLIDPDHPDLGPRNNEFVFLAGRIEHGRKEMAKRWLKGGFGSINWYEHTTVCEQSHHIAYDEATKKWDGKKWGHGKHHMKPDILNARFILFWGTGAFEANFGPPAMAELTTDAMVNGDLEIAVVDPRLSKTAGKAWKWLPVEPGKDLELAFAFIRWMFDHEAYDHKFLVNANKAAANAANELSWSDATHLVWIDEDGPHKKVRAADLGIGSDAEFVALDGDGRPVAVDLKGAAVTGKLFGELQHKGRTAKTVLTLLREQVAEKSFADWCKTAGLDPDQVEPVVRKLAKHGKRSVVEIYRGPVQHVNGYYAGQALIALNVLLGNIDHKGGLQAGGGHWHEDGSKKGQPFNLKKGHHPGKLTAFGHTISKEKSRYEDSTLFQDDGYPAKRLWFPHTGNVYQEVLPAAASGYPYRASAVFLHKGTPGFSVPGANTQLAIMADPDAIPLLIACDVVIGESSMYADYIFPDLSIWERWGTPHTTPAMLVKSSKVRQPTVAPLVESATVFGNEQPICMETVMLAIAEKLNLPGFGPNGFGEGMDYTHFEDFFLLLMANLAAGDKPGDALPEADSAEIELFKKARRHLPKTVYDFDRWKKKLGPHFRRVVYLLNRGGRYESYDKAYKGDFVAHAVKRQISLFAEVVATSRHSGTGKRFSGLPVVEPLMSALGNVVSQDDFEFHLGTYKPIHGGQSRTIADYWLLGPKPTNRVWINRQDAERLGLKTGDRVRLVSKTNPEGLWKVPGHGEIPIEGEVDVREGMRPGALTVSWSFGHWAYGSNDVEVDGAIIPGDARRRAGLCTNAVLLVDPDLGNVCLSDPIGGSTSFYDTRVNLRRAS